MFLYNASNISTATPGLFAIPTPTIDTLDKFSLWIISSNPIFSLFSSRIFNVFSSSVIFTVNAISLVICSPNDWTIISTLIRLSESVLNNDSYSVAGGYSNDAVISADNIKWKIQSSTGNADFSGVITSGPGSGDYAELFENGEGEEIPVGCLVSLKGNKVVKATGDYVFGAVSKTYSILAGCDQFSWAKKYLTNEFGEVVYTKVTDKKTGEILYVPKINPEYNTNLDHVSRLDRPSEWTPVGLIGQMYIRIDDSVDTDDKYIGAKNGIGVHSDKETNCIIMQITTP